MVGVLVVKEAVERVRELVTGNDCGSAGGNQPSRSCRCRGRWTGSLRRAMTIGDPQRCCSATTTWSARCRSMRRWRCRRAAGVADGRRCATSPHGCHRPRSIARPRRTARVRRRRRRGCRRSVRSSRTSGTCMTSSRPRMAWAQNDWSHGRLPRKGVPCHDLNHWRSLSTNVIKRQIGAPGNVRTPAA